MSYFSDCPKMLSLRKEMFVSKMLVNKFPSINPFLDVSGISKKKKKTFWPDFFFMSENLFFLVNIYISYLYILKREDVYVFTWLFVCAWRKCVTFFEKIKDAESNYWHFSYDICNLKIEKKNQNRKWRKTFFFFFF